MAKQSSTVLSTMGVGSFGALGEPSSATPVVELFHELGRTLEDGTQQKIIEIDPLAPPRKITFKSHVVAGGARSLRSPQYLATVRRRISRKIGDLIAALAEHASDEHFAVWTQEPLDRMRRLIEELSHAEEYSDREQEGNSCEVLRQLRDTFLDNGWQRYREAAIRDGAIKILKRLADAEEVSKDDAFGAMDELLDLGLKPLVGMAWSDEDEEELPH